MIFLFLHNRPGVTPVSTAENRLPAPGGSTPRQPDEATATGAKGTAADAAPRLGLTRSLRRGPGHVGAAPDARLLSAPGGMVYG